MRFIVELRHVGDGVEGDVVLPGSRSPQRFRSWLDLLRLLERPAPARRTAMRHDLDRIADLSEQIGVAESEGDVGFLDEVLAPALAFRRASGECVDRDAFLNDVAPGPGRLTHVESVELLGEDRAIVRCLVEVVDGDRRRAYDNFRLLVRIENDWKVLGWANAEREGA